MIPVTFFRSSSFNRWDFCPLLYTAEYVCGLTAPSGNAAAKGTAVHKVLEVMAVAKKANQEKQSTIDDEIVGKVNVNNYDVNDLIDKVFNYYDEGLTHLNWTNRDYKDIKEWTWMALEYNNGEYNPQNLDIVDAEPYFDFPIEEPWAAYNYKIDGKEVSGLLRMKGTIDLIHRLSEDTLEVHDWKSGSSTKNWATGELRDQKYFQEEDFQLRLYHLAACHLYPWAEQIFVNVFFIRGGGPFTVCFTETDKQKTLRMIKKRFEEIKNTDNPRPRRGWHCNLCMLKKQSFDELGLPSMVEFRGSKFAKRGENMKMCDQLSLEINKKGIDKAISLYTKDDFTLGHYADPGSLK